ncbi:MAG: hypothetical protein U9Q66_04410 [Patescibacteria group bacterium]|nr:hypothetical protein [Patescibacteria group bacterium]
MTNSAKGKRKSLWFSLDQIKLLDQIKDKTGDSGSAIVRRSLLMYSESLKSQDSRD